MHCLFTNNYFYKTKDCESMSSQECDDRTHLSLSLNIKIFWRYNSFQLISRQEILIQLGFFLVTKSERSKSGDTMTLFWLFVLLEKRRKGGDKWQIILPLTWKMKGKITSCWN